MNDVVVIDSLDDPRVWHYRNLKDRELDRSGRWFIAEGEHVVRRLLASDFPVESVFLSEKRVAEFAPQVPPGVRVYVAPQALMERVMGFKFHSGVVACGRRKPAATIDDVIPKDLSRPLLLVACPDLSNVENIGTMIRLCAGFGVQLQNVYFGSLPGKREGNGLANAAATAGNHCFLPS